MSSIKEPSVQLPILHFLPTSLFFSCSSAVRPLLEGKIPLRRLLEQTGHYDLLVKGKKGYAPDLIRLWKNHGKYICEKYLASRSNVVQYKIINQKWIDNAFEKTHDLRYINKLLSVLSLELWCEMYMTHSLEPNTIL